MDLSPLEEIGEDTEAVHTLIQVLPPDDPASLSYMVELPDSSNEQKLPNLPGMLEAPGGDSSLRGSVVRDSVNGDWRKSYSSHKREWKVSSSAEARTLARSKVLHKSKGYLPQLSKTSSIDLNVKLDRDSKQSESSPKRAARPNRLKLRVRMMTAAGRVFKSSKKAVDERTAIENAATALNETKDNLNEALSTALRDTHIDEHAQKLKKITGMDNSELQQADEILKMKADHKSYVERQMSAGNIVGKSKAKEMLFGGKRRATKILNKLDISVSELKKIHDGELARKAHHSAVVAHHTGDANKKALRILHGDRYAKSRSIKQLLTLHNVTAKDLRKFKHIQRKHVHLELFTETDESSSEEATLTTRKRDMLMRELQITSQEFHKFKRLQKAYQTLGVFEMTVNPNSEIPVAEIGQHKEVLAKMTLRDVLNDNTLRGHFITMLVQQFCEENAHFWMAAHEFYRKFPHMNLDMRYSVYMEIVNEFICVGAVNEINLKSSHRRAALQYRSRSPADIPRDIFLYTQLDIYRLMNVNNFKPFVRNPMFPYWAHDWVSQSQSRRVSMIANLPLLSDTELASLEDDTDASEMLTATM
jgi:hypothetical protein